MLRDAESDFPSIVGWIRQGQALEVFDSRKLEETILPKYFGTSKYTSFRRQLHAYGFQSLGKRGQCKLDACCALLAAVTLLKDMVMLCTFSGAILSVSYMCVRFCI
jgi:hypothetical protein